MPDVEVLQVQAAKERKCGERGGAGKRTGLHRKGQIELKETAWTKTKVLKQQIMVTRV